MNDTIEAPSTTAGKLKKKTPGHWVAVLILTVMTVLTFANTTHEELVLDDKAFVGPERTVMVDSWSEAFLQDIWAQEAGFGLYRPLLMLNFELENRVFGKKMK